MINGRLKGKRAELAFAKWLRGWRDPDGQPIQARRGQQFKGSPDSPDVVHSLKGVHFEVADRQNIDHGTEALYEKFWQADSDSRGWPHPNVPYVAWRKRKRWWFTFESMFQLGSTIICTAPAEEVMLALGCREIET